MSRRKRKPNVSAVINASLQIAAEQAEEFLRFLEHFDELDKLSKRKQRPNNASPAPAGVVVSK